MEPDLSGYPLVLLVNILDRVVDDAVMEALAAEGHGDLTQAHGTVFEMLDPQGSRVTDMARRARLTKQGMGQLVAAVEELGYVERVPDPEDGRARLVRMTPAGEAAAAAGRTGLLSLEERWHSALGDRRYQQVRRAFVQLAEQFGRDHLR